MNKYKSYPSWLSIRSLFLRLSMVILKLGRLIPPAKHGDFETWQIDEWLKYAPNFSVESEFDGACAYADRYLLHHTFLVGKSLSAADKCVWSHLTVAGKRWESLMKSKKYPNLLLWFNMINTELKGTEESAQTSILDKPTKKNKLKNSKAEVDLPDAEMGKVCVRFAPEPSGYLHIGHAKAALTNQYFAQKYKGKQILRFDDTNPEKESNTYVDNILKDVETLGNKYDKVTYTSDYFPQLIEMAEKLIKEDKAYVDDTPCDQMKGERMDGIDSKCRSNTIDENMRLWMEMKIGSEIGRICCLRGKLDMQDQNKSLRDPVYYRCISNHLKPVKPHHKMEYKYKVYPTYDFACPFVDAIEGITHALRSSEYHDRNAQYHRIQEHMGLRKVHVFEFSKLNMVYTPLSKRLLSLLVNKRRVDGWDDARFPTVQGIVRRGLQIEALIQFILEQGASKNLNLMEWDKLWNINKKIIDPVCPRHTAVVEVGRVLLTLKNGPENPTERKIPKHKKYEGAGEKTITYTNKIWIDQADAKVISANETITLVDWGNAIVEQVEKSPDGTVTGLTGNLKFDGSFKGTKKVTWLPDIDKLVPLTLVAFGHLITKKKLGDQDFTTNEDGEKDICSEVLNKESKKETAALGDSNMIKLERGDIVQLERKGYFRCDVPLTELLNRIVL
ncbi:glutamyl/glutaminyl-tRNA synthetase, class Ic [Artemisia annua]|uniref:glutamate--tRNA ligase n=1 Tax=Artemisia annua TaxID=35608 RepID=A0A2U1M001_ARTAN|nr:glutamyl/glutaminyl-tRNA synthetase, class Ic [Artemisia annua]